MANIAGRKVPVDAGALWGVRSLAIGIEEEFLVVDPVSREVVSRADAVVARAAGVLGPCVSAEVTRFQVEVMTPPSTSLAELGGHVSHIRGAAGEAARAEGVGVVASGSPVLGAVVPVPVTDKPRYRDSARRFRALLDEQCICGVHIHVDVPDRERAVLVSNHLRPWLPVLLAMAANSPYWCGRDTGYASWRTLTWSRWPVSGPPPYFESVAHYDALVATLLDNGALMDVGTIYWDVRPSAHLPTIELRVADVPADPEVTLLIAALARALVATALGDVERGESAWPIPGELLRSAYWRAARDGLSGSGVDPASGRLLPATDLVLRLLHRCRAALDAGGDLTFAMAAVDRLLRDGDGASRQRAAYARRGRLTDVVDVLLDRTAGRPVSRSAAP
ncbi:MAG: YbdK family carboxylate-amine ligase [Streptosporangiales bacterium]|nr:YbdK family carboxylate-amine ligase [Streptosporangiales bacterium]